MSNIPFNYLKVSQTQYEMPEPNNIWRFLKSQLGLFAGSPQKQAPMPAKPKNIPFASQKPKESPNIGDVKVEGDHKYIFLETTIGKPRWHTHEELLQMVKEGKQVPEIAKKKMPMLQTREESKKPVSITGEEIKVGDYIYYGRDPREQGFSEKQIKPHELKKVTGFKDIGGGIHPTWKPDKKVNKYDKGYNFSAKEYSIIKDAEKFINPDKSKKEDETKQAMELGKKAFQAGGIRTPSLDKELMKMLEGAQVGEKTHVLEAWNKGWDQENLKKPEEEPKQTEIPSEKLSKPKLSAEEQYVQDQIKKGDLETAIKRQQGMRKTEYTEDQQAKINDLNKLMQRRAQLQREIDAPLTAVKDVEKGGQKFEVDTKKYAKREMKYLDKRIGALKQELGKLGENLFETQEDIFSQATPEPKDQLSENINKQVEEQKKKEAPSLKTLMATQSEVLKLAAIPEEDIPMYALNSMADGAKLRSYSTEVIKGEITIQQAADKVKNDYTKMKEGEKPTNVAPLPSTEKKEIWQMTKNEYANSKENLDEYTDAIKNPPLAGEGTMERSAGILGASKEEAIKSGERMHKMEVKNALKEGKEVPSEVLKDYPELEKEYKDTLPLRPEDKDSKEGDIKTINGIQYQLKRGESGELRWHRVTGKEEKEAWQTGRDEYAISKNSPKPEIEIGDISFHQLSKMSERAKAETTKKRVAERKIAKEKYDNATKEWEDKIWDAYRQGKFSANDVYDTDAFYVLNERLTKEGIDIDSPFKISQKNEDERSKYLSGIDNTAKGKFTEKQSEPVVIPRQEAIEEHEHLMEVLENGTEEERKAEAEKQAKELKEYKGESLKEKVEERLSEKQAGKKFKDVGTRVGGSRKEIAAIRVLTAGDLDKLDNATAYRVVTKERILPDINPQAEKDNGVESGAAYMKKKLRESVNAKPPNTPEDRKKFVELTPKIFEKIDAAKTIEDIRTIGNEDFETFMDWGSRKRVTFYKHEDYKSDVSRLLGKEFLNLIGRNSDSAKKHWSDAVLMNSFNEETAKEQYKKYAEGRKNVVEMNKKRMDEYTAEQWERYFKTDPMTTMSFTRKQLTSE
ncbi:MAG: hypothetical protein WC309_02660, partial [Candidatus Paceibacterota bacterium]